MGMRVSGGRDVRLRHNILIVDDAKMNVTILERMLSELGHQIIPAYSGEEALSLADEYDFSVVLLDVKMPGMDGYEVARRLREKSAPNFLPVLFVTASADQETEVNDGYSSGGVDYLIKPVKPTIVQRKVEIFCQLQEKEKQIGAQLARIEAQKEQLEAQLEEMRLLETARMESEIRYRSLVSLSPQPIIVQVAEELVFYNTSAMDLFGFYEESCMSGRAFHTFVVEEDRSRVKEWLDEIERRGGRSEPIECTLESHDPASDKRQVELHACCILYDDTEGVQMAIQDVTEHKILTEKLRTLSQKDGLTGVWNRRSFDQQVEAEIRRHVRSEKPLSLIMIDLDQFKKFNTKDGMAIKVALKKGYQVAFLSSGSTENIVQNRAKTLGVERVYVGSRPKLQVLNEWCRELDLTMENVAYVGDDINDLEVMDAVGFSGCPADAVEAIQLKANVILNRKGGDACVREFVDEHLLD